MARPPIRAQFLINLVSERPAVWDKTCEDYKDRELKEISWREICTYINKDYNNLPTDDKEEFTKLIIKKWIHIRDAWVKSMKYGYDQVTKIPPKPYIYHNEMKFMQKILKCKPPRYDLNMCQLSNTQLEEFYGEKNETQNSNGPPKEVKEKEEIENENGGDFSASNNESEISVVNMAEDLDEYGERKEPPPVKVTRVATPEYYRTHCQRSAHTSSLYENRHWNFFMGILPAVNGLDEDHILQFQSGVISLLQDLRQFQKLKSYKNRKRKMSLNDEDVPVRKRKAIRKLKRQGLDPIGTAGLSTEMESDE